MRWKVAEAKQRFSELVRLAADEPQIIQNRDRVVAAVIGGEEVEAFLRWTAERRAPTLAETLEEMREAARVESWDLDIPARTDRPDPTLPTRRKGDARRHKRSE